MATIRPHSPSQLIDADGDRLSIYPHRDDLYVSVARAGYRLSAGPFTPEQLHTLLADTAGPARTRDHVGIITALILLTIALGCAWVAVTATSWAMLGLLVPAAVLFVLGVTGLVASWPRVPRDESGNRVQA